MSPNVPLSGVLHVFTKKYLNINTTYCSTPFCTGKGFLAHVHQCAWIAYDNVRDGVPPGVDALLPVLATYAACGLRRG